MTATIGAVLVAAILGLIYAVSKQDVDDTPEPTTQSQPANPAADSGTGPAPAENTAETEPAPAQQSAPTEQQSQTQAAPSQAAQSQSAQSQPTPTENAAATQPAPAQSTQAPAEAPAQPAQTQAAQTQAAQTAAPTSTGTQAPASQPAATNTQVAAAAPAPQPAPEAKPSFDVVRVNPNGDAVIAGRAAPGAKITLLDNGQPIGSATADDRGEWVLLPDSAVDPGQHKFSLKAQGEQTQESEKEVIVVVPKPAEDIAGQPVTKPSGALALEVPKQGEGPTQLLNAPGSAAGPIAPPAPEPASTTAEAAPTPPPPPLSLDTIDYTQDGRAMLSGHTLPGSDLIIYLDNASLGAAKADPNGRWTFVPETKAPTGDHEVRVDMVDGTGKVQARVKVPFAQPDFTQVKLTDDTVIVQPGNSLWRIARRTYGHGIQYTVIYEANKDRIGDPDLIYPGQIFTLPKTKTGG
ncbi:MAG TPA: LysM peptidoglycan-binding domain-containing protein [Dongiaceae bacterium]|nr:LysM peptidoglycan-binding domain-containing protein [Dongiaceae bacterium]